MNISLYRCSPRFINGSAGVASVLLESLSSLRGWLWRIGGHFLTGQVARCCLVFVVAIAVFLVPALAAEGKFRTQDHGKNASGVYPSKQDLRSIEESLLLLTNEERKARGLPLFQKSSALRYLAQKQSENMCTARSLEHESNAFPNGWKKFTDRLRLAGLTSGAENIAYRTLQREPPEKWAREVVNGWMASPKHRKNILNPRWRYLGVGVQMCANRIAYAAQVFSSDPGRIR